MKYRNSDFLHNLYYKRQQFAEILNKAKNSGNAILINTIRKLNNSNRSRQLNGDISIQDIFITEFSNFFNKNKNLNIRKSAIDSVNKMTKCGNYDYGYTFYECPNCENFYIQSFTCKSRFCPKCGKKYKDKIGTKVASKLINTKHRQLVLQYLLN